jgi:hypothetical protein
MPKRQKGKGQQMNTYQIQLPDGSKHTRNSKKTLSHAIIAQEIYQGENRGYKVFAFAGTKKLAEKSASSLQSKFSKATAPDDWTGTKFEIVEIKAGK